MYVIHYNDVIMSVMASQITSLAIMTYLDLTRNICSPNAWLCRFGRILTSVFPIWNISPGHMISGIIWNSQNVFYSKSQHVSVFCISLYLLSRLRHQMETFSALLAICAGNSPVTGEFPAQRPVARSFDVFFDLRLNKRLSKQLWGWWFETPLRPLWRHCNVKKVCRGNHCRNKQVHYGLVPSGRTAQS